MEDFNLLEKIQPPRLEDAGLEDCALPPHSIREAFLKAATAVGSRATSIFTNNGDCVDDPWEEKSAPSDAVVGIEPEGSTPGPCVAGKGGDEVVGSDVVVVGEKNEGEIEKEDEVVVDGGRDGGGGGCVDGLRGLEIKDKDEEREELENGEKKPILVEGYF